MTTAVRSRPEKVCRHKAMPAGLYHVLPILPQSIVKECANQIIRPEAFVTCRLLSPNNVRQGTIRGLDGSSDWGQTSDAHAPA
jgi:hypothetical protein